MTHNKDQILECLRKNGINSLWHFTDIRHLTLIRKLKGLRSKEYLEENEYLNLINPGGNEISHELDRLLGNWDKISLNFTPHTPMAYYKKREKHLVFIEIEPQIALKEGVYFTDCNATRCRNGQMREEGIAGLMNVRFDIINGLPKPWDQNWQKYVQAETLVPHYIPIDSFKAIHFIGVASKQYGELLWGQKSTLFSINDKTFADIVHPSNWTVQFSYIKNVLISNNEITKLNVNNIKSSDSFIRRGKPFWVILHLFANAGSEVRVKIKQIMREEIIPFDTTNDWMAWMTFIAPQEVNYIEIVITIDKVVWSEHKIEVIK